MTGSEYRDLIAGYVHDNFAASGLVVYTEVTLGRTIIGKDRRIDIFLVRPLDQRALAIECKFQESKGTVDEKIPYALQDLAALRVPGCLVYAGEGWSAGVLHTLAASHLAAFCHPGPERARSAETLELDHVLAATFGLWDVVLPEGRRFTGAAARTKKA